jgi:hypothetical protein
MLVLIDRSWLEARSADGTRRIDDPGDWVRREVEAVLQRSDAAVVPVLLDGAKMPAADALPESLRPLTDHQAVALTAETLGSEIGELIDSIEQGRIREYASRAQLTPGFAVEEAPHDAPDDQDASSQEGRAGWFTSRARGSLRRGRNSRPRTKAGRLP